MMIDRRSFLGIAAGAGASLALTPELLRALQQMQGQLIQRAIPSTGEMLPVIGLMFQNSMSQDPATLREVLRTMVDNGGRFLDTMHQSGPGVEDRMATLVTELGIQERLFLGLRGNPPGPMVADPAAAKAQIEGLFTKFRVAKLDLVQLASHADPSMLPVLKEVKAAGRVRYIASTTMVADRYAELEAIMRNEPIDFIGVDFALDQRRAEEVLLPLARERKIGVVAYFPFGTNNGALFRRVADTPLPEWAAEFDATSWAQFFLKYVVSHPAVTVVRTGTSNPAHMVDNIGGGIGRLPDEAMRRRMAAFIDALPPLAPAAPPQQAPGIALSAAVLDRYVGEYRVPSGFTAAPAGFTATFRRDGTTLYVTPGNNPEAPLSARSETRFQDPRGPVFEFQLDGQGRVTGAVMEMGANRIPLERQ